MPHQCTDCGRQFDDGSKEMLSGCPNCGGTKFQFLPDGHAEEPTPEQSPSVEESDSSVARKVGSAATAVRDFVGSSARSESTASGSMDPPTPDPTSGTPSSEGSTAAQSNPQRSESAGTAGSGPAEDRSESAATPAPAESSDASADRLREPKSASMRTADSEDDAQASARSEVISPDELPPAPEPSGWEGTTPGPRTEASPDPQTETSPDPQPESDSDSTEETERPDLSELRAELNQQFESIKVLEPGQYELNLMELFDREEYIIALQEDGKYTVQVPEHWQD